MKLPLAVLLGTLLCLPSAFSAGLAEIAASPAGINVANMTETPLVLSEGKKGWITIPKKFSQYHATLFRPDKDKQEHTQFTVLKDGYVLLACNYSDQGNRSGDWKPEAWDERAFRSHGWGILTKGTLGGDLTQGDKRPQVIFYKKVRRGESYDLRCNKYDPPYPILLH